MCTPKPAFPPIFVSDASPTKPVSIPRRRISLATSLVLPMVDDVFEKENSKVVSNKRRPSCFRGPVLSALSPNSPLSDNSDHFCLNTPGRDRLQKGGVDAADLSLVGKGGFGSVVMGSWKGQRVAVKVIATESSHPCGRGRSESVRNEHNALLMGNHRNVVRTLAIFEASLSVHNNTVVIMEFAGKSNLQCLISEQPQRLTEQFVQRCFEDVSSGLSHVHSLCVAHLDVKPSNVLVSRRRDLFKLGDFGSSKCLLGMIKCREQSKGSVETNNVMVGTPGYQAPELIRGQSPSLSCDVYSFGVLMWQVLSRETPFAHLHPHVIIYQVAAMGMRPKAHRGFKRAHKRLVEECWHQHPHSRPTMPAVQARLENIGMDNLSSATSNAHANTHKRAHSLRV